jgi:hypothetical protein
MKEIPYDFNQGFKNRDGFPFRRRLPKKEKSFTCGMKLYNPANGESKIGWILQKIHYPLYLFLLLLL